MSPKAAGSLGIDEKVSVTLDCEEWVMVSSALSLQADRDELGTKLRNAYAALRDKVNAATLDPTNVSK